LKTQALLCGCVGARTGAKESLKVADCVSSVASPLAYKPKIEKQVWVLRQLISVKPRAQSARVLEEQDGNPSEAVSYARRYFAEKGAAIRNKEADEVRGRIARLDSLLTPPPAAVVAAAPPPQPPLPAKLDTRANVANGVIVAGGLLTLVGISCLVGAWTTSQAAKDPAISYHQWGALGSRGRALNAAGLGLTIAGGAGLIGGTAWRLAIAKRTR